MVLPALRASRLSVLCLGSKIGWWQSVRLPQVLFAMFSSTPVSSAKLQRSCTTRWHIWHAWIYSLKANCQASKHILESMNAQNVGQFSVYIVISYQICTMMYNVYGTQMTEKCNCLAHQLQNSYIKPSKTNACRTAVWALALMTTGFVELVGRSGTGCQRWGNSSHQCYFNWMGSHCCTKCFIKSYQFMISLFWS